MQGALASSLAEVVQRYHRPMTFHQIAPTPKKAIKFRNETIKPLFHHSGCET
jgi:hypothetical protein